MKTSVIILLTAALVSLNAAESTNVSATAKAKEYVTGTKYTVNGAEHICLLVARDSVRIQDSAAAAEFRAEKRAAGIEKRQTDSSIRNTEKVAESFLPGFKAPLRGVAREVRRDADQQRKQQLQVEKKEAQAAAKQAGNVMAYSIVPSTGRTVRLGTRYKEGQNHGTAMLVPLSNGVPNLAALK